MINIFRSTGSKHAFRVSLRQTKYRTKVARYGGGSRSRYRKVMRRGRMAF